MSESTVVIATRASVLAKWQAQFVAQRLQSVAGVSTQLLEMTTQGDKKLAQKLSAIGGKGLFVKELEEAVADGRAHFAVHSLKDVPMTLPDGFTLAAVSEREVANDVFISARYASLEEMPAGAIVGTSSLRREMLIRHYYPTLEVVSVRGNVATRLSKLDNGVCDALIMAYAGIKRLGLEDRIREVLPLETFVPSPGQGALGIECATGNAFACELARCVHDEASFLATAAEREVSRLLGGSCQVPLGALARIEGDAMTLTALIGDATTGEFIRTRVTGKASEPLVLAQEAVRKLLAQGAARFVPEGL